MLGGPPGAGDKTFGADKNYDTAAFVAAACELNVTRMQPKTSPRTAAPISTAARRAMTTTEPIKSFENILRRRSAESRTSAG